MTRSVPLRTALLQRSTRALSLTDAGRSFFGRVLFQITGRCTSRIPLQGASPHRAGCRQTQALQRITLRCEKTAQNFAAFNSLACTFILVKSVHTA
jgi:hypothetical protein